MCKNNLLYIFLRRHPCYNEIEAIIGIVKKIRAVDIEDLEFFVVVVASTEGTRKVPEAEIKSLVDKIIYNRLWKQSYILNWRIIFWRDLLRRE